MDKQPRKAVVVGAGPVGCLAAMALAKAGWRVEVYEGRPDSRSLSSSSRALSQRSINLAISARGIAALEAIDPAASRRFLDTVIPMKGRMIHDADGRLDSQLYDRDGQCINSIDRGILNDGLLDEVSARNIPVFFQRKLTTADFDRRVMTFRDLLNEKDEIVPFDFCVGADGSYSNVRRQLMRFIRMDYQQEYLPHEYMELRIPPARDANGNVIFAIDPDHLHIWPRTSFMLIALPNKDKSFTCTLFAPTTEFARLRDPRSALHWFRKNFPDALPHIGEQTLLNGFQHNPRSPLIAIKAKPYHYKDRVVILGDAAHSMVPFFGQGLNCGFEDVRVLDVIMRAAGVDPRESFHHAALGDSVDWKLENALLQYSESRHDDLVAICDLSMGNYVEMRHSVATPTYLFLKYLDHLFAILSPRSPVSPTTNGTQLSRVPFPSASPVGWIPMYTMVTFRPDISYGTAKRKAERQARFVATLGWCTAALVGLGLLVASFRLLRLVRK